jgi:simple sugar transport system ATP-binding protein
MVGAAIRDIEAPAAREPGPERLSLNGLSAPAQEIHGVDLKELSLNLRGGEVVGVAGVAGNGQSELFAALSGEIISPEARMLMLDGALAGDKGITRRRQLGAAFVPEERNGHGAAGDFTLTENVILSRHATGGLTSRGFVNFEKARALARTIIGTFDVRKAGPDPAARTLSGGNLQKFVVGREILSDPGILVINQPTWGVDAAAAATIRQALLDLAARGAAVLLISQDLDELFEICDRIAVMRDGRLSKAQETRSLTREDVGLLMAGAAPGDGAHAH